MYSTYFAMTEHTKHVVHKRGDVIRNVVEALTQDITDLCNAIYKGTGHPQHDPAAKSSCSAKPPK